MLLDTLELEATLLGNGAQTLVVTLATLPQTVIIANDHTHHTEPIDKHTAYKLLVGLCSKLIVEARNDNTVDTRFSKQTSSLLDGSKQLHTLGTSHSYARMGIERHNDALGIEP